jgi:hypothetical protein
MSSATNASFPKPPAPPVSDTDSENQAEITKIIAHIRALAGLTGDSIEGQIQQSLQKALILYKETSSKSIRTSIRTSLATEASSLRTSASAAASGLGATTPVNGHNSGDRAEARRTHEALRAEGEAKGDPRLFKKAMRYLFTEMHLNDVSDALDKMP